MGSSTNHRAQTRSPEGHAPRLWPGALAPPCLIVLVGPRGVGKSTWARARYPEGWRLSERWARRALTDDARAAVGAPAHDLLEHLARGRLGFGRGVVLDACNTRRRERQRWYELARELEVPCAMIWFEASAERCMARQRQRDDALAAPVHVLERQRARLEAGRRELGRGPWDVIARVRPEDAPGRAEVVLRRPLPRVRPVGQTGGVRVRTGAGCDIIGDVHGCREELEELLGRLGWELDAGGRWRQRQGRRLIFVGDLCDRGPDSVGVLELACDLVERGQALLVRGNHDDKLRRYLRGNDVTVGPALATTAAELEAMEAPARQALTERALEVLERAPLWALVGQDHDDPREGTWAEVVVSHAAWDPSLVTSDWDRASWFTMYGPTTGEVGPEGYPERLDWRVDYPARAPLCVHGHTAYLGPVVRREGALCLDTGCVFGGRLSALRWPEDEIVAVPARRTWAERGALGERPGLVTPP